jgi:hypothetical protein
MNTPAKQILEDNPDNVPGLIKVIVVWLYILAVMTLLGMLSFQKGHININLAGIITIPFSIWSAYHLGYKRNFARLTAIGVVGWQLILLVISWMYVAWQEWKFWLTNNHVFYLRFDFMGQELNIILVIVLLVLTTGMNFFTLATLLQPKIKRIFVNPAPAISTQKQEAHEE